MRSRNHDSESFLIVDDERLMRDTLRKLLEKQGYEAVTAADGFEAIELAESRGFDFIVCDVRMSSIDGIETIRRVKQAQPNIRSIIITGFASQETPVKAIKLGVDDYIFKPFELDEFLHSIKRNVLKLRLEKDNRRLESRMAEAKERLERIIESINDGLLLVDNDYAPTLVNAGFEAIYDLDRARIGEGRCYETLLHRREVCPDCPLGGGEFQQRRITLRLGGRPRILWIDGFLIEHEPGRREMVHVVRDVTEWEKLRQVRARSEKLAAVGQLAAGVAHEIRNPLGAINTAIGVLKRSRDRGEPDAGNDELFEIIAGEVGRVNRIIEQFLEFARPRKPEVREVEINALVGSVVKLIAAQAPESAGVRIEFEPDPDLGVISIDPDQVQQVVWNLGNNALEFMAGSGRLEVATSRVEDQGGDWAVIRLADTGPGIAPEDMERIFEPFYTTRKKGAGLGLAISQSIAAAHGGRIEVDSTPGRGSAFSVFLPVS